MTRPQNLFNLINLYEAFDEETLKIHSIKNDSPMLKNVERDCLKELTTIVKDYSLLDDFHVGFTIENIGKEFDLIKMIENSVINIELKSESSLEKILQQQKKNEYYLKGLQKNLIIITFESKSRDLYKLEGEETKKISLAEFKEILQLFKGKPGIGNLNEYFKPSDYLISPFNNTGRFLENEYFLTNQQKDFQNTIFKYKKQIQIITGNPGTGKTLLLYDLIKLSIDSNKRILAIHCGQLNQGHEKLIENGWNIKKPHSSWIYDDNEFKDIDILFIDEAQRLYPYQLKEILLKILKYRINLVCSLDPKQYLDANEKRYNNIETLKEFNNESDIFNLTSKIRTNKQLASFIKVLFSGKHDERKGFSNISIDFFSNEDKYRNIISTLELNGWKNLTYTPSKFTQGISYSRFNELHNSNSNSHKIIGQEYDKVVVLLDESFSLDESGNFIIYDGPDYYDSRQMLYQNITRARNELKILIYKNVELYKKLITIVTPTR